MSTKRRKGYMTLAEHDAKLKAEGKWNDYVARQEERENLRRKESEVLTRAEAPLVQALASVGLELNSVWDLVNRSSCDYAEAVPVLMDHLKRPYPDPVRGGIARALAVASARAHWGTLLRLYEQENGEHAKEGLAVAIAWLATDDVIGDVIALATDRAHGTSRVLLLGALARSKERLAQQALVALGADPQLKAQVQATLKGKTPSRCSAPPKA